MIYQVELWNESKSRDKCEWAYLVARETPAEALEAIERAPEWPLTTVRPTYAFAVDPANDQQVILITAQVSAEGVENDPDDRDPADYADPVQLATAS